MNQTPSENKERFVFHVDPSEIARCQRVANARYGGNKALVMRIALREFLDRKEEELGDELTGEVQAA